MIIFRFSPVSIDILTPANINKTTIVTTKDINVIPLFSCFLLSFIYFPPFETKTKIIVLQYWFKFNNFSLFYLKIFHYKIFYYKEVIFLDKIDYKEMGKRIKQKRKELNLTQEKLSEILEISPTYISEIERGTGISSLATITKIANVLNLDLDYLILGISNTNIDKTFSNLLERIPKKDQKLFISLCENIANTFIDKNR